MHQLCRDVSIVIVLMEYASTVPRCFDCYRLDGICINCAAMFQLLSLSLDGICINCAAMSQLLSLSLDGICINCAAMFQLLTS